jgi:hypothetical protein
MTLNVLWKWIAHLHMVGAGISCHPQVLPTSGGSVIVRPATKHACFICHRVLLLRVTLHLLQTLHFTTLLVVFWLFFLFRRITLLSVGVTERGKTEKKIEQKIFTVRSVRAVNFFNDVSKYIRMISISLNRVFP